MGFDGQDEEGFIKDVQLVLKVFPGALLRGAADADCCCWKRLLWLVILMLSGLCEGE